ncbi:MAG TPA: two-component sensor histidine kinase, partial [Elainellaceae cyanobacterium]
MNRRWCSLLFSARTQILAWLVVLISVSIVVSIFTIRQILFAQLLERVQRSLKQEVEEIQRLVEGQDPETGQPFGDDVASIFDVFLSRNVPENDEFLIALLNGDVYQTSPLALPEVLSGDSALLRTLAQIESPHQDQKVTSSETIIYLAYPLQTLGTNRGVFVVAHSLSNQWMEIDQAVWVAAWVIVTVFLVASFLAWLAIGRVLSPLQLLTETAHSI